MQIKGKPTIESASQPQITATSTAVNKRSSAATWGKHSPVVMATLRGNHLGNCRDVQEIYGECIHSGSNDSICQTAENYFGACMSMNKE